MNRRQSMFKIKALLPQHKQVELEKNGQVVRRMTVRRKSHYVSGNRRLRFELKNNFHFVCYYLMFEYLLLSMERFYYDLDFN